MEADLSKKLTRSVLPIHIQIIEAPGAIRVVTIVELVAIQIKSASNARVSYRRRRNELIANNVDIVEIDLLRSGKRLPHVPSGLQGSYYTLIERRLSLHTVAYSISLRDQLPTIPIPLRVSDKVVSLNLQEVYEKCYANGRYWNTDYSAPLDPALDAVDDLWVDRLLHEKGMR